MTPFQVLFYSLLIVLVEGQQNPISRNQFPRQWVRERNRNAPRLRQSGQGRAPFSRRLRVHSRYGVLELSENRVPVSALLSNGSSSDGREPQRQQADPSDVSDDVHPVTWRGLLLLNNVTDLSSFIRLLTTSNGQPVREEDLFRPGETPDGKRVIAGSDDLMASPDECSPRNMSVRLDLDVLDPAVAYYPECTQVERCGGCTPSPYLDCVPRYKEIVILSVLKARYPYPGAVSMDIEGFAPVRVERHLSCRLECNLKSEDCPAPNSVFLRNQCRCQCKTYQPCTNNNQVWVEELCRCRCRNEVRCCGPEEIDERRCPVYFDHSHCECTLKESVEGPPNATQAEMEAWLESRRGRLPSNEVGPLFTVQSAISVLGENDTNTTITQPPSSPLNTTTVETTTASTTIAATSPTTTTTRASSHCSQFRCPRFMVGIMSPTGRCLCQYTPAPEVAPSTTTTHPPPPLNTTTTTTATTTTTTRPTPTTTRAGCRRNCPGVMVSVMTRSGRCLCQFPRRNQ